MATIDVVDPMTGNHEQVRPLEEISGEIDKLDAQIRALQSKRGELSGEHDRTAHLMGSIPRFF